MMSVYVNAVCEHPLGGPSFVFVFVLVLVFVFVRICVRINEFLLILT